VRKDAASALSSFDAAKIEGPLLETFRRDQSYGVQGAVLSTLVKVKSSRGTQLARDAALSDDAHEALRAEAVVAYAEVGDETVLDVALRSSKVGVPYAVRSKAIPLVAKHGKGSAEAYAFLERQARTENYDMQGPAIEALGELGDARAMDTLRAIASDDRLDGRLRSRARKSMREILAVVSRQ
jgi:hypothetical protein